MNKKKNWFWRNFTWKKFLLIAFCMFTITLTVHCIWNYFIKDPVSPLFTTTKLLLRAFASILFSFTLSGLLKKGFWMEFVWKTFFLSAFIWLLLIYPVGYFFFQDDYKNFGEYTSHKLIYYCSQAFFISFVFTALGFYEKRARS